MLSKKRSLIFFGCCLFSFLAGIFCGVISSKPTTEYIFVPETVNATQPLLPETAPAEIIPPSESYYMNSNNNIIYVYSCSSTGETSLLLEIDYIDMNSLSKSQKSELSEGISFPSMEDVARFIQDLGT